MTFILWPHKTGTGGELGGKARALAELAQAQVMVPAWFVLTPSAFYVSLTYAQRQTIEAGDVRMAATLLRGEIKLEAEPMEALTEALQELCPNGEAVAVRSSAGDEDGAERSFAGQFDSFLFVPGTPEAVAERVAAVWRSAFSHRIVAYREHLGLPKMPQPPSVLIQRMVNADRSGVAFGADPVSHRRGAAVVAAVWGLGTALVSGECDADTYHVDRAGKITLREIAVKRTAHCAAPDSVEGVEAVPVPESESTRPVLADDQVLAVAELVRSAGRHSGNPRDIEWAIEAGKLYLLQSRPITVLAGLPDPDGVINIWDNSNIAESYNGITTPLTFSFARRAYTEVYRGMCRTLGVADSAIAANDDTFRHMLGLIRGRVYYNLLNWYRVLVLLPGFTSNRKFMEQMMGVKEGLPEAMAADLAAASDSDKFWDRVRMARTAVGMAVNYLLLPKRIGRFYFDLDDALAPPKPPLDAMRPDELAALYRGMEQRLLSHWDPPLVNDLFAMIFYGLLGKLTAKWCGDSDGTLRNELVRGKGGMVSAEPAQRVRAMAAALESDPELAGLLCTALPVEAAKAIHRRPAFSALYTAYLDKFGDRCLEELKLESPTLHDDPTPLNRAIGRLAVAGKTLSPQIAQISQIREHGVSHLVATIQTGASALKVNSDPDSPLASQSVKSVEKASLPSAERVSQLSHPRRWALNWVMRNARDRVRDRENLRFERTRLFGRVRRIFLEIGKRFTSDRVLEAPRDVFYLEVEEILGYITGASTCTNLRALALLRKEEFDAYRKIEAPDDRFETHGVVYADSTFRSERGAIHPEPGAAADTRTLKGLGCCPGIVRAKVRLILDPHGAEIEPGSILAAVRTDPGWVMLFPAAAGLLVEHGSLLSHSAIVAREMGIPAIVSIPGLTRIIADGDIVEMDGSTGVVRRISERVAPEPALKPSPIPPSEQAVSVLLEQSDRAAPASTDAAENYTAGTTVPDAARPGVMIASGVDENGKAGRAGSESTSEPAADQSDVSVSNPTDTPTAGGHAE